MAYKNIHNDNQSDIGKGGNSNCSSESITLRFDKTTMNELRNEAEQKLVSVNALLNQIVRTYTKWHKPAKRAGLIYINRFLYKDIVEHIPNDKIKTIANNYARDFFMDTIEMFDEVPSISFYIDYLPTWLEISGFNYRINQENPDYLSIKIQLDLGQRFSEFIAVKIQNILEALNQREAKIEATDHLVIVRISNLLS
ncbi:MAG TPA: hypothetical protein VFV86_05740 [Nitrososphaeraceae archaeon]|nr:hypothetical protein [Nitrososphaeraceae archaeon]